MCRVLLHDIGKLVMALFLADKHSQLISMQADQQVATHLLESQLMGFDHADIGGQLLQHWRVPESIWEPVRCHHSPLAVSETTAINCALYLADTSVSRNGFDSIDYCDVTDDGTSDEALEFLKLDLVDIEALWPTVKSDIDDITRQFLNH